MSAFPFRVGRSPDLPLSLPLEAVSWNHAEFDQDQTGLWIRDLQSTNGTWANGKRVSEATRLSPGDLVQFASLEFVVGYEALARSPRRTAPCDPADAGDGGRPHVLRAMLRERAVSAVFQPIVDSQTTAIVGFEALGRTDWPGLPRSLHALFLLAGKAGVEAELSQTFRQEAVRRTQELQPGALIFLNAHPVETHAEHLIDEFSRIRSAFPQRRFVLEIHEAAITDPGRMRALADQLALIGVALAYDDFGAGKARLAELAHAPPHYLKFDRSLIHEIERADPRRQRMVGTLVQMAHDLGVVPLAEGIEREAEASVCRDLGFTLAQGFYFGKPAPASTWRA